MMETKAAPWTAERLLRSYTNWYAEGMRQYADTWDSLMTALPAMPGLTRGKQGGCGPDCGCDPCTCCTPPDADVVVRMRLGERRVVPVTIVNEWRREREITLSMGDWAGCPGDRAVTVAGLVHPSGELTLAPCERRQVVVEVMALPVAEKNDKAESKATARGGDRAVAAGGLLLRGDRLPDVDTCATYCGELRVEGCAHRPVSFAVQVLPRSCDAYELDCSCGCC